MGNEQTAIEIRQAGPPDAAAILPLMAAFNAFEQIVWRPSAMGAALRQLLQDPALGCVLVAERGPERELIGYAVGAFGYDIEFAGRDAFINELYVTPEFRGRGCGRTLLQQLVAQLRASDVRAVHLMVRPENERARALYESLGFELVPRQLMTKPIPAVG